MLPPGPSSVYFQGSIMETSNQMAPIVETIGRERFLNLLVDNVDANVIATDADGVIVFWNRRAEESFGWRAEEVLGKNLVDVTPTSMNRKEGASILRAVRSGESWSGEFDLQRRDGTVFPAHVRNRPILGTDGELIGIVGISHDITYQVELRRRLEQAQTLLEEKVKTRTSELRQSQVELRKAYERLRRLLGRLHQITEEERRRVARELHDEVGQRLTGLRLTLERMTDSAPEADVEHCLHDVDALAEQIRELTTLLHPTALDALGLLHALVEHIERWKVKTGIEVVFDHLNLEERVDRKIEIAAYRIVQEGLTNTAKHADAGEVTLRVWKLPGLLTIQIEDEGNGFDPGTAERKGLGFVGIEERALSLGGKLRIDSSPGEGTCLTIQLPLEERKR
ncbi:MAG: PAS domain S-box protein, partial [Thermoanaerobaculia bacterium]|nr:PAS domain S-box protein [Thermoanaerobaculia bacterium]